MADEAVALEVEAALFSAGDPVAVEALAETTGHPDADVREALRGLRDDYDERTTALEVAQAGDKWTMQVETGYADQVRDLAPMEVPDKVLKTLALVAYHQPILQSDLQTMVGSRVYDHVRELSKLGLVTRRRHERTYELRTTDKFPEYFGLETTDPEEIREALAEAAGVPRAPDPAEAAGGAAGDEAGGDGTDGEAGGALEDGGESPEAGEGEDAEVAPVGGEDAEPAPAEAGVPETAAAPE